MVFKKKIDEEQAAQELEEEEVPKQRNKRVWVVEKLPTMDIRETSSKDGTPYELVTFEEAMSEILNTIREIKKNLI